MGGGIKRKIDSDKIPPGNGSLLYKGANGTPVYFKGTAKQLREWLYKLDDSDVILQSDKVETKKLQNLVERLKSGLFKSNK